MKNCQRMNQNWNRGQGKAGVVREGNALLQGIVYCGLCGRKMGVQHRAAREKRSSAYLCQSGYEDGDKLCQSMTSRPVDRAVVEAFLESVCPLSVEVGLRVVEQLENDLAVQRRQRELQLEQARYETRLAQRPAPGEGSLKTPPNTVAKIHEMAGRYTYADIAERLNAAGCRTAFGRRFTSQHVGYICRRDKVVEH